MRRQTTLLLVLGSLPILNIACSRAKPGPDLLLTAHLDEILARRADSGATFTARVLELPSRRELYASDPDAPHTPASNMKLPTSATALDIFGADHQLETYLAFDGENLWIVGTGDPAVGDPAIARAHDRQVTTVLDDWAQALRARGVTRISGKLLYYDRALESVQVHPSWGESNLVHWYAAPVSGLNFNDNCVDITVYPTSDGALAGYEIEPPVSDAVIVNKCVSGDDAPPSIAKMPHGDVYVLGGGCTKRRTLKSKPVGDPGWFFADALRTHLRSVGIEIEGATEQATEPLGGSIPPPAAQTVAVHRTAMTDIMWRINKSSQNLFAECMYKLSGQELERSEGIDRAGNWAAGARAVRAFLAKSDIDDSRFSAADGSGLSHDNKVTARLITDILATMYEHRLAEAFRASLAEPGGTGTLRRRMKELNGQVFAKTGYIRGVRALSGYIHTDDDRWLCFSIIYNRIPGSVQPFNDLQDEACRLMIQWPDLPPLTQRSEAEPTTITSN
jgi:D-alanyl-D-alanine carboxypeptidase/D-alanyl-D-alanine-endopeptidase (penicillin-binding protein 4)